MTDHNPAAPEPTVQATRYTVTCVPADSAPDAHHFALQVEMNRDGTWTVTDGCCCLDANGDWYGLSGRRLPEYRHSFDAALELAKTAAPHVLVNGLTPASALARIARLKEQGL